MYYAQLKFDINGEAHNGCRVWVADERPSDPERVVVYLYQHKSGRIEVRPHELASV